MAQASYPLSLPSSPSNFRTSEWTIVSTVAVNVSPYTYSSQSADFGGYAWRTVVTLPPMKREEADEWQVFFMQLHGRFGTFLLGDPDSKTIQGGCTGTIQTNAAHSVGAYDVTIDGAPASTIIFKKGDYVQFGSGATSKLHMIVADITSNSSGVATLQIEPPLKTALSDNSTVVYSNTKGVFRMDSNELTWNADQLSVYGISFSCSEVI